MKGNLLAGIGLLVLGLASSCTLRAEDAEKPDDKAGAAAGTGEAKPADQKLAEAKAQEQKRPETKTGTLAEKPVDALAAVAAVLTVKSGGEHSDKKAAKRAAKRGGGDPPATEQKLNLLATGDLATKLADLARKSAKVSVTGTIDHDAMTMKVTDVTENAGADDTDKKQKGKRKNQ